MTAIASPAIPATIQSVKSPPSIIVKNSATPTKERPYKIPVNCLTSFIFFISEYASYISILPALNALDTLLIRYILFIFVVLSGTLFDMVISPSSLSRVNVIPVAKTNAVCDSHFE